MWINNYNFLNLLYNSLEWGLNSPPKTHAFISDNKSRRVFKLPDSGSKPGSENHKQEVCHNC